MKERKCFLKKFLSNSTASQKTQRTKKDKLLCFQLSVPRKGFRSPPGPDLDESVGFGQNHAIIPCHRAAREEEKEGGNDREKEGRKKEEEKEEKKGGNNHREERKHDEVRTREKRK